MATTFYIPPHIFENKHRFDYDEPAYSFFNPDRDRLASCTRALHAHTGHELNRGAGKTTAIAHMVNWEIQDGPPNKKYAIIINTRSAGAQLFDKIIRLHKHYTMEGVMLPTLTVSSPATIATNKQQQFMFYIFENRAGTLAGERFYKAWFDVDVNVRWDATADRRMYDPLFDRDEDAIGWHLGDIFSHFDDCNTKVYR